jgi:hypothetical protein
MTSNQIEASARARAVFVANRLSPGASYNFVCRVETTGLPAMSLGLLAADSGGGTDLVGNTYSSLPAVNLTGQGGNTVRVLCEADNATMFAGNGALYLDEVSVALVRTGTL